MKEERSLRERILRKLPGTGLYYVNRDLREIPEEQRNMNWMSWKRDKHIAYTGLTTFLAGVYVLIASWSFELNPVEQYRYFKENREKIELKKDAEFGAKEDLWNKLLSPGYADADSNGDVSIPEQLNLCGRMGNNLGVYIDGSGLKESGIKVIITSDGVIPFPGDRRGFMTYRKPTLAELTKADASYTAKRGSAGK